MATDPRADRDERRPAAPLGFPRSAAELDPRIDQNILSALSRIAPGTELRQGIDDIIRSHEGALIVIGEPAELAFMFSGGIRLDQPFTPQLLYELAKMDGAIIIDASLSKLAYANVQLMPDPTIPSNETGTRHRTAERVAKQTGTVVKKETREVLGEKREYLTIKILHNDMTVNVPSENVDKVGLRKVIDQQMVEKVVKALTGNGTQMP